LSAKREKLSETHSIRLTKEDSTRAKQIAKAWSCAVGDVLRRALREFYATHNYLDAEEKKALGISG
jgi:uncharacterized protein (DUF2384 family)